ncbi:MAG TPA: EVE domain-containing protein [Sporosarcina psychrophila]|uniref:EVE domain-containing protein n=1 Tax=Sporosarcina psychrophila TaxID=1476 RepID=A0A921KE05_SPOPS|nr:EVE domain-containing protein [Sporosarcina psychrophila]
MKTWIFQGNPTKFNVDDYLLQNDYIWWSIRQEHFVNDINLDDEVFIWRSDGENKGSGGVVARTKVVTLPQEYTNDEESSKYWYEDVSGNSYLAVELEVLEVDEVHGINRLELQEHEMLSDLLILRLRQNTNYLVADEHASFLRQLWYSRVPVNPEEIDTRFPLVTSVEEVIENMKRFEKDVEQFDKLYKQISSFQQWYYIHEEQLLAPSKFIGYRGMKGHMYIDKDAIAWTDGRATVKHLKQWFVPTVNPLLRKYVEQNLDGRTRKDYTVNILKSEVDAIDNVYSQETGDYSLPLLQPSGRIREYNFYSDELKAGVIFEHLVNNETHRWLDINVLGIADGSTKGRSSANILYYLGMKADYRGIFQGEELSDMIQVLKIKGESYSEAVRLLKLLDDTELDRSIDSDLEAEQAEEGNGIEGHVKYYYGKRYERDSKNRKLAIKKHGLNCYACGFNFEEVYGERGKDFIEVHHIKPLSTLGEAVEINPDTDLVPLCANCHRMVHRRKNDVLSVDELNRTINIKKIF